MSMRPHQITKSQTGRAYYLTLQVSDSAEAVPFLRISASGKHPDHASFRFPCPEKSMILGEGVSETSEGLSHM